MLSEEDGQFLIKIARRTIENYLNKKTDDIDKEIPDYLKENLGVFVTLTINDELRGCIGYPEPVFPLINAVKDSAISAATRDPRFPALKSNELDKIKIEISVLTKPQLIEVENNRDYPEKVIIGEDGLIIELGHYRGLLLPQVATDYNFSSEEFLSQTCLKSGLNGDCWLNEDVKIFKFQAQIFNE